MSKTSRQTLIHFYNLSFCQFLDWNFLKDIFKDNENNLDGNKRYMLRDCASFEFVKTIEGKLIMRMQLSAVDEDWEVVEIVKKGINLNNIEKNPKVNIKRMHIRI